MIRTISILNGRGKNGRTEPFGRIDMHMGEVVSIVGPTGSGKTTLINDIELFANANTPSGRRVLINGAPPPAEFRGNPARNPIALITQHTTFLSDLPVRRIPADPRPHPYAATAQVKGVVGETLDFCQPVHRRAHLLDSRMTELSGGQTRALLIADATVICNTPIVLLDEVENAGHPSDAGGGTAAPAPQDLPLRHPRPAHRPAFGLPPGDAERRVTQVLHTDDEEQQVAVHVTAWTTSSRLCGSGMRQGERLTAARLEGVA